MNSKVVALAGNPNSGKTTLFNQLTGSNQYVGNWPGVTVEKKEGKLRDHPEIKVQDLPGIYSLASNSIEEKIAAEQLSTGNADLVLNIVDGTNLERNLYLTLQLQEMGLPVLVCVNMLDVLEKENALPDLKKLSERLGLPVLAVSAATGQGVKELIEQIATMVKSGALPSAKPAYSAELKSASEAIARILANKVPQNQADYWAIRALENADDDFIAKTLNEEELAGTQLVRDKYEAAGDEDAQSLIAMERYALIDRLTENIHPAGPKNLIRASDRLDQVLTNRWLALPIFALVMVVVYGISVTTLGTVLTDWTNEVLFGEWVPGIIEAGLDSLGVADWLKSLVLDGIVAGVGAVLGFVPQILLLFFFLAFLEGSGYLARVAFIMDRIFRRFGLSGKSFIPMLIGSGCSVPGIMASRTIEEERDRRMTITVTSFIPCGAKLPVIALLGGALFNQALWVAPSIYFLGIGAVIVSGIMLKKTPLFSGPPVPFVMELPSYRWPTLEFVLRSMWERGSSFIRKAETVILLSSIVIWFLSSFGVSEGSFAMVEDTAQSLLAVLGSGIAWVFTPLGWGDWKAAVATITGLVAKENVVGTFGVLFGAGEVTEAGAEIWSQVAAYFTPFSGYSFLIFNMICAPCFAAIGAIRREMNSGKWTAFAVGYQTVFAYALALIYYQIALWLKGKVFSIWTGIALVVLGAMLYQLLRPAPKQKMNALAGYAQEIGNA